MKLTKTKFFFIYEVNQFKPLSDSQHQGLSYLLSFIEEDARATDIRHVAYMLATTYHETAMTFKPIAEYGKGKGRKYGTPDPVTGKVYYGRGYVQLTWADNYKALGKILDIDLYNNPDAAMLPEVAYAIMSYGMHKGSFTGVGLKKYINETKCDYANARRIINGTDCAEKIAEYAVKFENILKECVL